MESIFNTTEKIKLFLAVFGIIASVLVGIGEFYLHYSPNVLHFQKPFQFFQEVSLENLQMGHWFILIGIPFYFGGYLHIYQMLKKGNEFWARVILTLGFMAFTFGGIWISSRLMIGNIVHLKSDLGLVNYDKLVNIYSNFYEVLVQILRIIILLLSIAFAFTILKYRTHYPKWMAIFNPITILLVFVGIGFAFPSIGKYTLPILMNITHLVLFAISLFILCKTRNETI